jgi:hypothetical protein
MSANDRAIDDGAGLIDFERQLFEDGFPVTFAGPVRETVVDGFPRSKTLRQVTPRHPGLGAEQDRFDEKPIALHGGGARRLRRKNFLKATPLGVRERMSVHAFLDHDCDPPTTPDRQPIEMIQLLVRPN